MSARELRTAQESEILRLNRLYDALSGVSQAIVRMPTRDELFRRICRVLVENGGFRMAWIGWHDPMARTIEPVAMWGDGEDYVASLDISIDDRPEGLGPTATAFREERSYVCNDLLEDPATLPWREAAARLGFRASAAFPIRQNDDVCGTINVYANDVDYFKEKEIVLLREAAADVSFALDNLVRDATREQAEELLRDTQARLRSALQAGSIGTWTWDIPNDRLVGDEFIARMFSIDVDAAAAGLPVASYLEVVHEADRREVASRLEAAIRSCGHYDVEYRVCQRDGDVRWLQARGRVDGDAEGNAVTFHGAVMDITERKHAEMALREAHDTLEERVIERTAQLETANRELEAFSTAVSHDLRVAEASDRLKSAFLATMSHELRTPLNSILGFTGILQQRLAGPLNEEQSRQLGMVQTSARHLLELINDVLDLSKIEAGQMEVHDEPFDLPDSVRNVADSVGPLVAQKDLSLDIELSNETMVMVSDRRRVEQILLNLLSNAIKFTDNGRITLSVDLVSGDDSGIATEQSVRFRVTDTGIGIRPEDLSALFQPFRQLDSGLTRKHEGTGLGLVICRRLVTLLGGDIAVTSEWAKGSEFTVILPMKRAS